MVEYIERGKAIDAALSCFGIEDSVFSDATVMGIAMKLKEIPSAVVHCKDCIRRPHYDPPDSNHNSDLEFPDDWNSLCPYYCEDNWYSRMPRDDWFCNFGKRKDGET